MTGVSIGLLVVALTWLATTGVGDGVLLPSCLNGLLISIPLIVYFNEVLLDSSMLSSNISLAFPNLAFLASPDSPSLAPKSL